MGQATMFLSTPQAAERLGISPRTLEQYRRTGEGPVFHRFGYLVRYLAADIDAWAAARRRITTDGRRQRTVGKGSVARPQTPATRDGRAQCPARSRRREPTEPGAPNSLSRACPEELSFGADTAIAPPVQ